MLYLAVIGRAPAVSGYEGVPNEDVFSLGPMPVVTRAAADLVVVE